jgi:hypothetical protein
MWTFRHIWISVVAAIPLAVIWGCLLSIGSAYKARHRKAKQQVPGRSPELIAKGRTE